VGVLLWYSSQKFKDIHLIVGLVFIWAFFICLDAFLRAGRTRQTWMTGATYMILNIIPCILFVLFALISQ
jgi:hypothetical protein